MSKLKSVDAIKAGWNGLDKPKVGQIFEHYKGGEYEIVATGFLEDTEAPCIVYRSLLKDIVWVRTAKNFLEVIEYQGEARQRFRRVANFVRNRPAPES